MTCRTFVYRFLQIGLFSTFAMIVAYESDAADPQQTEMAQEEATSTTVEAPKIDKQKLFFEGAIPKTIEELRLMEKHIAKLAERVKPAVVNIQLEGAQGSGVVVSSDGYILTAAHVIGGPQQTATITFPDGKQVKATTLGSERRIDSGILKIQEDEGSDFPYVDMGLSDDLSEGQWLMAIGHPGGIDEQRGLVVRFGRLIHGNRNTLRTDCTLVGGDSGGPLFDMNGEVIGIHSRIGAQLWNNLHVPIDTYSENWDDLVAGLILDGRPNLGFNVVENSNEVDSVVSNKAASKSGLQKGDFILKIDSIKIEDREDIRNAIRILKPYQKIKMVIKRAEEQITLDITVGEP